MVSSLSNDLSQPIPKYQFSFFEKRTREIDSKLMRQIVYDHEGIGEIVFEMVHPFQRKHEWK
jgi:hypothetical protein